MHLKITSILMLVTALAITHASSASATPADELSPKIKSQYNQNPERFSNQIEAFEAADVKEAPPAGAIVAIGSSSMRLWSMIDEDLAPITIVHRGFGGSNLYDVIYYSDRILLNYEPRAILLYEGDNDITSGVSPKTYIACFKAFVEQVHDALPETRIYVISVKPSPKRIKHWPNMQATNKALKKLCEADPKLTFIDVSTLMLDENGVMIPELFVKDGIHMTQQGYEIWKSQIHPVLIENELDYENSP